MMDDEVVSLYLPYHSKVRWLSQVNVLVRIEALRGPIIEFSKKKNKLYDLLDFAILCDVMS